MRSALIVAVLVLLGAGMVWRTPAQTTGDDLAVALENHGMDTASAPIAAAAIEIAISNNNGYLTRIGNVETAVKALQAQASGPGGVFIEVPTKSFTASSPASLSTTQQPVANATGVGGFIIPSQGIIAGEQLIYSVNVPVAGTYLLVANLATSAIGPTMHIEMPAGTIVTGEIAAIPTGHFNVCKPNEAPALLTLPAGTAIFTVSMESGGISWGGFTLRKVQ
jgi:hypothetical protein